MQPGSPAQGYGCYGFPGQRAPRTEPAASTVVIADLHRRTNLDVGGPIDVDTIWAADTVRVHTGVTVLDGVTLTVAAGTFVEFQDHVGLDVQGRLLALGEPEARIRFDRNATLPGADNWRGIAFLFTPETNEPSLLRYCEIEHAKGNDGGALTFVGFSRCRVENTVLRNNTADRGGAVYCSHYAAPELVGCLMVANHALVSGAALYCVDAYPRLVGCTVTGNVDHNPEPVDRAVAVVGMISKLALVDCIVWDNPSSYFLDESIIQVKPFHVRYCDVEFGHDGEGNLDVDPLFAATGKHPYRLVDGSFCVDAGGPDTTGLRLPELDLAGVSRIDGYRVDMGCYEGGVVVSGVEETAAAPGRRRLSNHPNPFNPHTVITFTLPREEPVRLQIFDASGRLLRTLIDGAPHPIGRHEVVWAGRDDLGQAVPSGVYLCRLLAGGVIETRRLVLVR